MNSDIESLALANFKWLRNNVYPGRGIVVGLDQTDQYLVQVYWIMGRSENSRNRAFRYDCAGRLYTEAANPATMTDPTLVIYNAMREDGRRYIVSNGDQTDTVAEGPWSFLLNMALVSRQYEPDAPNFTQRITAVSSLRGVSCAIQMSILRKSLFGEGCDRLLYEYIPQPGFGHCITTYAGDGDPLPPFCGDPLIMPIRGTLKDVAVTYWDALKVYNRVALAVKFIRRVDGHSDIYVINQYKQYV